MPVPSKMNAFVVIAGSVGNLPRVHIWIFSMHNQVYLLPATLHFRQMASVQKPHRIPEMILVSDVDLDLLNELHTYGSVRNLERQEE